MPMSDSKSFTRGWWLPILLLFAFVFVAFVDCAPWSTEDYRLEAQKSKAQLGCTQIATAIEAFCNSPQASWPKEWQDSQSKAPRTLRDLAHPPHGGSSYLRNGDADTVDPWGKPFQLNVVTNPDGSAYLLITTTAPDGTPISQHGIGEAATPRE